MKVDINNIYLNDSFILLYLIFVREILRSNISDFNTVDFFFSKGLSMHKKLIQYVFLQIILSWLAYDDRGSA